MARAKITAQELHNRIEDLELGKMHDWEIIFIRRVRWSDTDVTCDVQLIDVADNEVTYEEEDVVYTFKQLKLE